tara:strand:- start:329 stop:589 length:261 start_codon:yes stop_codon:yes gene_type:complete
MLQSHYSLFDSFFAPTRVLVVSEERLQQAEREAKQNQLDAIDARIEELSKYRTSLYAELKTLKPTNSVNEKVGGDLDALDGGTHDG